MTQTILAVGFIVGFGIYMEFADIKENMECIIL